jgi:hypothetical protein
MNCKKTQALFGRFLDQGLDPEKAGALMAHMESCPECARKWDQFRLSLGELKNLDRIEPSPDFEARLWRRIHEVEPRPAWREALAAVAAGALWTKMAGAAAAASIVIGGLLVGGVLGPGQAPVPVVEDSSREAVRPLTEEVVDSHRANVDLVGSGDEISNWDWDIPNWARTRSGRLERGFTGIEGMIDTAEVEPEFVIRRVNTSPNSPPRRAF